MNDSLLTYSGGQPLYADDLSFMQNSLSVMTNHLAKAFGDTYIVWGCLDEEKSNVIAGAVCIGGKLYEVPALGLLGENKLCYREVQSDEREFEDGQRHNVKKSYEAYLSTDTSGSVAYIDLKTARNVQLMTGEWDDTPTIEFTGPATDWKWTGAYVKRIRHVGGWLYFVRMTGEGYSGIIGNHLKAYLRNVQINNSINISTLLNFTDNTAAPVLIKISNDDPCSISMYSETFAETPTKEGWDSQPEYYAKWFYITFSFFDPDINI